MVHERDARALCEVTEISEVVVVSMYQPQTAGASGGCAGASHCQGGRL